MASPPFEVEDQTDEDFFDKLVNDDDDDGLIEFTGSRPSIVDGDDSDELKAFANLSISDVDPTLVDAAGGGGNVNAGIEAEKGSQDGVVLESIEDTVVDKESDSVIDSNVNNNESSEVGMGEEGALDGAMDKSSVVSGTGVKEVQWSAFNSDSHIRSGSGFGSYMDIFKELGDNLEDPFANVGVKDDFGAEFNALGGVSSNSDADLSYSGYGQTLEGQYSGVGAEQNVNEQDLSSSQYWENLYPGWRYDPNTGQWHQLDGYDANVSANATVSVDANAHESFDVSTQSANDRVVVSDQRSDVYYLQQTAQSVAGSVAEGCTTASVTNWDQSSQGNVEYPAHMVFNPQFPGWYYDTITQEWKSLESYTPHVNQSAGRDYNQQYQSKNIESYGSQGQGSQDQFTNWSGSMSNYNQQNMATWQAQPIAKIETAGFTEKKHIGDPYGSTSPVNNFAEQHTGFKPSVSVGGSVSYYNQQNIAMWQAQPVAKIETTRFTEKKPIGDRYGSPGQVNNFAEQHTGFKPLGSVAPYEQTSWSVDHNNGDSGFQSFIPTEQFSQHHNQNKMETSQQMHFKPSYLDSQNSVSISQQPFQSGTQFSSATGEGRSSAGRPPHTLVTFGFGGKLIVMKNNSYFQSNLAYGNQDSVQGVVNVHNLMEVVMDKTDASSFGLGSRDYFHALCQQSFPGPLVGGNVGNKELNKWIDDRIANCESPYTDYRNGEVSRLLFSLLKIACQYYGKLRSPFGTDQALKESDSPEPAVANLFASAKINSVQSSKYGALMHCLQNMPSEAQIQATALEVQKLLVSGRKKEALQCAQEGQLWGPALVLASKLGDQFYGDIVKQMALKQLVAGSPLRTLCLLIAGQPADIFSSSSTTTSSTLPGSVITSHPPAQIGSNFMLDEWEENLAIITANRTKDDELVIVHLGDCLWKERGEVTAAHICYLVSDANFEPYSDSARLCLISADHLKFPRTYASPEAIQRTELYEYSKVLGNSQFLLLPFQPYKLIYAHMLAEVGKVADSLKYCQAILKSLKTGRAPEVDTWKQLVLSLEERLKTHQQGGYGTNLAPAKLVGKLLTFFDSTAHRVVGGLPPPVPSTSHSSVQYNELAHQQGDPKVSNSQSTMAMSSLMPSASMEPISGWTGETNQLEMPNRSISEPDFGRSPRKVGSSKEANSSLTQEKVSVSGGSSRFGQFGSQLFQKTVGLVLRSRPDKQAKLGEKNRFYYDEKLKRWVEEGAEPPAEEAALPPPPTTAAFLNGMPDHNIKDAPKIEGFQTNIGLENKSPISSERSSGIPPIPPSSNQFSARGRMGVRSRYVDTFNKGGEIPTNLFQSHSVPAAKPGVASNPKFFIPTPVASGEETVQTNGESVQETVVTNENPSTSLKEDSFSSPPPSTLSSSSSVKMQHFQSMGPISTSSSSMTMQRFPSMDNIAHKRTGAMADGNDSLHSHSRRTASWSGGISDAYNPSLPKDIKPLGEALGMPFSSFADPKLKQFSTNGSNFGDDLHQVEI